MQFNPMTLWIFHCSPVGYIFRTLWPGFSIPIPILKSNTLAYFDNTNTKKFKLTNTNTNTNTQRKKWPIPIPKSVSIGIGIGIGIESQIFYIAGATILYYMQSTGVHYMHFLEYKNRIFSLLLCFCLKTTCFISGNHSTTLPNTWAESWYWPNTNTNTKLRYWSNTNTNTVGPQPNTNTVATTSCTSPNPPCPAGILASWEPWRVHVPSPGIILWLGVGALAYRRDPDDALGLPLVDGSG